MLESVDVGSRTLHSYRGAAADHVLDDLVQEAERLRGARVLHVNATPYGGGVSALLRSVVPLLNDLGVTLQAGGLQWSDWGSPRRMAALLRATNEAPPWLARVETEAR